MPAALASKLACGFIAAGLAASLCSGSASSQQAASQPHAQTHPASQPSVVDHAPASAAVMPAFETDFNRAVGRAKAEGKVLFVEFYRQGCPYCQRMQKRVYPDADVIAFADRVVWARIDQEVGDGVELRSRFRAGPTPMYMAISLNGKSTYYRYSGAPNAKGFLHNVSLLPVMRDECELIRRFQAAHASTLNANLTIAQRLTLAKGELMEGRIGSGRAMLEQIVADDAANQSGFVDDALVLLGMLSNGEMTPAGRTHASARWLNVIREYPSSDRGPDAVMYLAKMMRDAGDKATVDKLNPLIKDYPTGVDVAACAKILEDK